MEQVKKEQNLKSITDATNLLTDGFTPVDDGADDGNLASALLIAQTPDPKKEGVTATVITLNGSLPAVAMSIHKAMNKSDALAAVFTSAVRTYQKRKQEPRTFSEFLNNLINESEKVKEGTGDPVVDAILKEAEKRGFKAVNLSGGGNLDGLEEALTKVIEHLKSRKAGNAASN